MSATDTTTSTDPTTTTTSAASSSSGSGADLTQLLSDLESADQAISSNDWVTAGLDGATALLDLGGSSPLSSIVSAGFGLIEPFISFLEAPLKTLMGDGSSTSTSSQGTQSAGQNVTSTAGSYQQAAGTQTNGWSGTAASNYQSTASDLATELRAIGKATSSVATATSAASTVVSQAQQIVTQLVTEAGGKINTIMTQAMATAQITGGASIAAAIPQAVGVATDYGTQIAGKMGSLLSSGKNLAALLLVVIRCLEVANTALTQTTSTSSTAATTTPSTSTTGTGTSANDQTATVA